MITAKEQETSDSLSSEDQTLKLAEISRQYLKGEITYDKYKKLEEKYRTDFYQVTLDNNSLRYLFKEQMFRGIRYLSRFIKKN